MTYEGHQKILRIELNFVRESLKKCVWPPTPPAPIFWDWRRVAADTMTSAHGFMPSSSINAHLPINQRTVHKSTHSSSSINAHLINHCTTQQSRHSSTNPL